MSKINVLVLITVMDRAGAETMLMNYLRSINRDKIQMDFLINRKERADYENEIEQLGSKVYHMCPLYPGRFGKYKREFRKFLTEHPEYRIIHSNLEERSYFALRIAGEMGIPVRIAHAHSAPKGHDLKMFARLYFRKRLQKYCTHKMACGEKAARWLFGDDVHIVSMKEYICNKANLGNNIAIIMRNAIDTRKFAYTETVRTAERRKLKVNDGTLVIGHIGRFTREKNQSFLIDAFLNVNNRYKNSTLLLIGGGTPKEELKYKEEIQRKVKELGLTTKVKFLGVRDDIHEIMQAMDIFVMPSISEGFPVTLVEAQALGLKCLVSDGVSYEVNMTEEIQYKSLEDGPEEWANKIISFTGVKSGDGENKVFTVTDEDSTKRMQMNQKVSAAGYDIMANTELLENLYKM